MFVQIRTKIFYDVATSRYILHIIRSAIYRYKIGVHKIYDALNFFINNDLFKEHNHLQFDLFTVYRRERRKCTISSGKLIWCYRWCYQKRERFVSAIIKSKSRNTQCSLRGYLVNSHKWRQNGFLVLIHYNELLWSRMPRIMSIWLWLYSLI